MSDCFTAATGYCERARASLLAPYEKDGKQNNVASAGWAKIADDLRSTIPSKLEESEPKTGSDKEWFACGREWQYTVKQPRTSGVDLKIELIVDLTNKLIIAYL